jgi:hypothetical protein
MSSLAAADERTDAMAMVTAFHQGEAGNCASISVIKLAVFAYGYPNVFAQLARDGLHKSTTFTLRDGKEVSVTDDEVASLATLANFEHGASAEVLQNAQTMYAVMAKNKCNADSHCREVTSAITQPDGYLEMSTEENFKWLGLERQFVSEQRVDFATLKSEKAYVVTNAKHSAFAYAGEYDEHGIPTVVEEFRQHHSSWFTRLGHSRDINGAYRLKPL